MTRESWASTARYVVAATWIVVPVGAAASAFGSVVDGHPAYPVLLAACALVGVVLFVWAVRRSPRRGASRPTRAQVGEVESRGESPHDTGPAGSPAAAGSPTSLRAGAAAIWATGRAIFGFRVPERLYQDPFFRP